MTDLNSAITKRPPNLELAAQIIAESMNVSFEYGQQTLNLFEPIINNLQLNIDELQSTIERLNTILSSNTKLSDIKLAQYFLSNPTILEGFEVLDNPNVEKDNTRILYNGHSDNVNIRIGFNKIKKHIALRFGSNFVSFKTISDAILTAYDWHNDTTEYNDIEISILDIANLLSKNFRITEIKKALPSLNFSTKEIEHILLCNGFTFKQYKNSRVKYFYKNN